MSNRLFTRDSKMKSFTFVLGVFLLSTLVGQQEQYPWSKLNYQEALLKSSGKIMMLDFYTDW